MTALIFSGCRPHHAKHIHLKLSLTCLVFLKKLLGSPPEFQLALCLATHSLQIQLSPIIKWNCASNLDCIFFFMLPLWIILDHQLARRLKTILQTKVSIWEKKDPMSYHYHCHTDLCSVEEKGDWYSPAQPDDLGNQWGFTNRAGMEPSLHKSLARYWGKEGRFSATIFPV